MLATLKRWHTIASDVLQRRRPFSFKDPSLQAQPLSMALSCWPRRQMGANTLRVDFAAVASQNGFQHKLIKLPFIRKTKTFRKTKKHWNFYHFHLETRSLYETSYANTVL